jgi:hypothetical protein
MGFGDYRRTVGKQSALWVRPGGKLIASGEEVDIGAILMESGTAVFEQPAGFADEVLMNWEVRIPRILVTENQEAQPPKPAVVSKLTRSARLLLCQRNVVHDSNQMD